MDEEERRKHYGEPLSLEEFGRRLRQMFPGVPCTEVSTDNDGNLVGRMYMGDEFVCTRRLQ